MDAALDHLGKNLEYFKNFSGPLDAALEHSEEKSDTESEHLEEILLFNLSIWIPTIDPELHLLFESVLVDK